jgi:hypothetical protein
MNSICCFVHVFTEEYIKLYKLMGCTFYYLGLQPSLRQTGNVLHGTYTLDWNNMGQT